MASVMRIFRLFRLSQHFGGFKILLKTVRSSARELLLLIFILGLFSVLYAAAMYFAERYLGGEGKHFDSVPAALWWAIITLCTVG